MKYALPTAAIALIVTASALLTPQYAVGTVDTDSRIVSNDNRLPAGRLERGVLTVRMEAREGTWYPDGPDGAPRVVAAFAEEGKPLQNPGPLLRVVAGTEVRVTLRNSLGVPLTLLGLGETRGIAADSVTIEPGDAREMRFTPTAPGTYWYAGRTDSVPRLYARRGRDSQLNGVIVVDPPGTVGQPNDRIFLISWWVPEATAPASASAAPATLVINGLSWPHTERFDVAQGDSLHWRWVSMTAPPHPMHLHGFYFRVDGKGNGSQYSVYTPGQQRLAVTEILRPGETMQIAWSPSKPGNWIFHCHLARHMTPRADPTEDRSRPAERYSAHASAEGVHQHEMARLVLGIRVSPRGEPPKPAARARPIRLLIRSRPASDGEHMRYGYALGGSAEEGDTVLRVPGPTLVLQKDEPVAITVVNKSHEPAAVHWHGIELESFPDGVPGWSGSDKHLLPAILAGDSITVRFTPPRAGTFMYHSHFNEMQQIASGLYGTILVLNRGQRYDPETDRVLLFSDSKPTVTPGTFVPPLLNGQARPEPMQLRAGVTYRLRVINIRSNNLVAVSLVGDGDKPVEWRVVAKDGADLPGAQAVLQPAQLALGPGEIYDYEITPRAAGELSLRFGFPRPPTPPRPGVVIPEHVAVAVHVR